MEKRWFYSERGNASMPIFCSFSTCIILSRRPSKQVKSQGPAFRQLEGLHCRRSVRELTRACLVQIHIDFGEASM